MNRWLFVRYLVIGLYVGAVTCGGFAWWYTLAPVSDHSVLWLYGGHPRGCSSPKSQTPSIEVPCCSQTRTLPHTSANKVNADVRSGFKEYSRCVIHRHARLGMLHHWCGPP